MWGAGGRRKAWLRAMATALTSLAQIAQRNVLEDNINLENLRKLKSAFAAADENGGGSLDVNEFVHAFQNSLNLRNLDYSEDHLRALFQKVR